MVQLDKVHVADISDISVNNWQIWMRKRRGNLVAVFFKANLLPFIGYSILHTKQHPFIEVTPVNPGNKIFQSILTNEKAEFVWAKLSL